MKFSLFFLNIAVAIKTFSDWLKVVFRYYRNPSFRKVDLSLIGAYFFHNPYRLSRDFQRKRGAIDPYTYGETPLTTLETIAKEASISSTDTLFELGCGRGRGAFFLHLTTGCRVIAIDEMPVFIKTAKHLAERFHLKGIEFREANILESSFEGASVLYFYGTSSDELFLKKLAKKFEDLPKHTRLITVSFPIDDYSEKPLFTVVRVFPAQFLWGEADIYQQVKN